MQITEVIVDISESKRAKILGDALNRINTAITSTLDLDEMLRSAVSESLTAMGAQGAGIAMLDGGHWVVREIAGLSRELIGVRLTADEAVDEETDAERPFSGAPPVAGIDALSDRRFDRRLMERFGVRSMLSIPLAQKEKVIGALFFTHGSPSLPFDEAQVDFAGKLGVSLSLAMENSRLYEVEHNIAETLQAAVLRMPRTVQGIDFGCLYRSSSGQPGLVGGDFYDLFELEHNRIGLLIGDVSGKGLQAAALASLTKNTIKAYAYKESSPASVLANADQVVQENSRPSEFVTAFFGILDTEAGSLAYCSAGHHPPLVCGASCDSGALITDAPALGLIAGSVYADHTRHLEPDDLVLLFTDGVPEARGEGGFFGEERLMRLMSSAQLPPVEQIPEMVLSAVLSFTGEVLSDDIALLAVSLAGARRILS